MSAEFWDGTRVLVTGAGGFIGSHLVETLVARGARVRAFLRYTSRADRGTLALVAPSVVDAVEILQGDLRSIDAVRGAVAGSEIVMHLGALISIPFSYVSPEEAVDSNVRGTLNVLQAARDAGVRRVVHTSSSEVYGTARYVPMDEAHPLQGQSPYSASKIGADKLAESFARSFDLPVVTLRPFNTFGPRQSTRAVIPTIITQLLRGATVRLGSLHPRRDFTFVADTVAGFLKAAEVPGLEREEINLGTGRDVSVEELVALVARQIGRTPQIVTAGERVRPAASEVDRLCASNRKARDLMGWTPEVSLEEGLRRTIAWIEANQAFYQQEAYHR